MNKKQLKATTALYGVALVGLSATGALLPAPAMAGSNLDCSRPSNVAPYQYPEQHINVKCDLTEQEQAEVALNECWTADYYSPAPAIENTCATSWGMTPNPPPGDWSFAVYCGIVTSAPISTLASTPTPSPSGFGGGAWGPL